MKKKLITLFVGLFTALSAVTLMHFNSEIKEAKAKYTQTASEYYSGIDWDETGADLKTSLFSKIKIDKAGWTYDGLWTAYQTTDVKANGKLWDIYSDLTNYTIGGSAQGANYSKEGDSYNREHMIPQSIFNEQSPMVSDAHHVLPSDGYVNNRRSNYPHGNVTNATYTSNDGYKLGTGSATGSTTVFEPKDCYKGDIARIYFYFVTCYQDKLSGFDTYAAFAKNTYPSISTTYLNIYLQWAKDDPVSQKEIDRNRIVYETQGNRNPFVDSPYAIGAIWDSTHASDYGTKGQYTDESGPTDGITISNKNVSLEIDSTTKISATTTDSSNVSWSFSPTGVATLNKYSSTSGEELTITGQSVGTTTLTASATIGGESYTSTCSIEVTESGGGGGETEADATMTPGTNGSACTVNGNAGIKIGTSSKGGDMSITVGAGATKLILYAAAWKDVSGLSLNITGATVSPSSISLTADSGVSNNSPFTLAGDVEDFKFEITLSNITEETTLTFTTSIAKRCAVWGAKYVIEAASPSLKDISLNTSNVQTEFTLGDTFDYSGLIVTAYYDNDTEDIVEPTSVSSPNMMTLGEKEITVTYTEGEVTKTKTYTITVVNADVTSVQIDVHSVNIILNKSYDVTDVSVTVLPATAVQTTEWVVSANTVSDDYTWNGTTLTSGSTAGSITLRCQSTADNSKYDELVVTVTGDPIAAFAIRSYTGYVSETIVRIDFTYGNIEQGKVMLRFKAASSDGSIAFLYGTRFDEINKTGYVQIILRASGNATLTLTYDNVVLDSIPVTSLANNIEEVNWSASNIDVFSGASLTADIDSTWNVNYRTSSGDTGNLSYGEYTLKLGGNSITLPHTWVAEDDGKTLCVEYGGTSSSTVSVTVTQTINNVWGKTYIENDWGHELTSQTWSAAGSQTLNGKSWTMSGNDDGTGYMGWDNTKGQQFGSGKHPYTSITLTSTAFEGTISKVEVTTSGASSVVATVSASVGNTAFKCNGSASASISATSTKYTFTGKGSGTITISWSNSSSKAIYFKVLGVTTLTEGQSVQIANSESHKEAQRVAVKFANAFNDAMDDTEYCTAGLNDAWSECASAYSTFLSDCAALEAAHEGEGEYAKNLVRYATAQYSDDSGEACIERAMRTYEICVSKHHLDPFMYDDDGTTPLRSINVSEGLKLFNIQGSSTILIVSVVSLLSVIAVGGYFFLRKRKED